MFKSKEKIGFQVFMRQYYLPLIKEMVDSEIDLLYTEIERNTPPIIFSKEQTEFELFILLIKVSGYGLGKIEGREQVLGLDFEIWSEIFSEKFGSLQLNPQWVHLENPFAILYGPLWDYHMNKLRAYSRVEQLYQKQEINRDDLHRMISEIFFSLDASKINEHLITAIGELHKGGLIYSHQKLASFAQKYQIVLDEQLKYTVDDQNKVADLISFRVRIFKSLNSLRDMSPDNLSDETISRHFAQLKTIRQDEFDTYQWPLLADDEANRHIVEIKTLMNELFDSEVGLLQLLQGTHTIVNKQEKSNLDIRTLRQNNANMKSVANKKEQQFNQMEKLMLKLAKQYRIS
jgi:hypothetical protein